MLEVQTGFVNMNGTRLWYEAAGEDRPFVMLHELADRLVVQAPDARKVVIADAGHHPNMEHPAAFERVVREFLVYCSNKEQ